MLQIVESEKEYWKMLGKKILEDALMNTVSSIMGEL